MSYRTDYMDCSIDTNMRYENVIYADRICKQEMQDNRDEGGSLNERFP